MGDLVSLKVLVKSQSDDPIPFHVAVNVKNGYDQLVVSRGTHSEGGDMYFLEAGAEVVFNIDLKMDLEAGNYTFSLALGELIEGGNWQSYCGTGELGPLSVGWSLMDGPPPFYGPFGLPIQINVAQESAAGTVVPHQ
jgi:hypothetical protein